jgi:hypothetical protein
VISTVIGTFSSGGSRQPDTTTLSPTTSNDHSISTGAAPGRDPFSARRARRAAPAVCVGTNDLATNSGRAVHSFHRISAFLYADRLVAQARSTRPTATSRTG